MSVKSIENSTLGLAQINGADGTPSITISPDGVVALISPNQATSSDSNAISTIAYVNQSIADASVALDPNGSYIWGGTYNIFGNNMTFGIGGSTLPTVLPTNGTSSATGLEIGNNASLRGETDLYNFSNTGAGGFDFWNLSATSPNTNYASLNPNAGVPIFNLKGTGAQYQINGTNILNNVITTATLANYALIDSQTFTGIPKAPKAVLGTNSTQLATCSFVADAIGTVGNFNPATAYTWTSPYQLYGNDQVLCVGNSLMNTNKPQVGLTSPEQGSQICNNTQIQGETDFVNYSGAGVGGFAFQQMSSTNTLTNLATMYRNGGACILNLPNASSQFQIGGANILDGLTAKANINSPALTGIPTAPTATAGTSTTQIATTQFVEDAIFSAGTFSPDVSYTWASAYQRFGNDQVLCVGNSAMNTGKPVVGATSSTQGTQICNATQTRGETDFVNYSATGTGGFCFQQMSSTNALNTMATMYRSGATTTFNLPNASSQFQVNGVNIARQTTSATVNATAIATTTLTFPSGVFSSTSSAGNPFKLSASTINGMTTVYVFPNGGVTDNTNITLSNITFTPNGGGATSGSICPLQALNTIPAPINNNIVFNVNFYSNATGVPVLLKAYGALIASPLAPTSYNICIVAYQNIPLGTTYGFDPFSFTYASS
jgi:hypothetical protein